ncbi:MAG: DNA-deoxyinosine glycosylase [Wenzhouxiangellaceae bacterium]|nr:DNA-deoxyinosine glycosylase [Wenzhouxiangellaceae bacterium]
MPQLNDAPGAGSTLEGFDPVWHPHARVLVLGSMPGVRSLQEQQYYAHPRNAFWPIMRRLVGADPTLSYCRRVEILRRQGIALWDVIAACQRPGSLDSRIRPETVAPNDFQWLFVRCPAIERIAFNGRAAEALFQRHVLAELPPALAAIPRLRLPSTSPAYAAMSMEQKAMLWHEALAPFCGNRHDID